MKLPKSYFYREEWDHGDGWITLFNIHDYTTLIRSISPSGKTMKKAFFEHRNGKVIEKKDY